MTRIWGFDFSEVNMSAFSSQNMFDKRWPWRRERFISYQCTMLVCLAAQFAAIYSLFKYQDLQTHVQAYSRSLGGSAMLHNDDIIASEIVTVLFCVFVSTIFSVDFLLLLFFPRRQYPGWYNVARRACVVILTLGLSDAAIMSTFIVARHSAFISNSNPQEIEQLVGLYFRPPLRYASWSNNIAYVVLLWIGWACTVISTIYMFIAIDHDQRFGTTPWIGEKEIVETLETVETPVAHTPV